MFGGSQFTAGRYGGDRAVSTANFAVGAMATFGRWRWWATVPYIFQDAATVRTVGAGMLPVGGIAHSERNSRSSGMMGNFGIAGMNDGGSGMTGHAGYGDPVLRVDATVWGSAASTRSLALYSSVKLPFASASNGFGTGKWDEAVGATLARRSTTWAVLADVAYWRVGRSSGDPYRDVMTGTITAARPLGWVGQQVYGSLLATTPFVAGAKGPVQLGAGWSRVGASRRTLSVTAGVGMTPTAPAFSLSAGWSRGLR
ncbi:MAG: hypothetical protein C0497_04895 [Gemmatimonas sp.]|nr:hypothetical protein [Gemmatimonas sp.]